MEESKEEISFNQICPQTLENPLIPQLPPPQIQTLNLEFEQQRDKIKIEEEEDEIKEDISVPSIQPPNAKPANEIPLHRSTIKKIQTLYQNFKPIRLPSSKKQPFLAYEDVFRALNLWEFLNLDFESEVRSDLIVELICTYDELEYSGFVRGFKIDVGKFDVAHAFKVPVEKIETHESIFRKDETKEVILKFLSRFVFLDDEEDEEDDDDMCILPEEAIEAIKLVKNGTANEVDWCGLIRGLVVKDILDAYMSGYSQFASYLHCLIKTQHPNLLLEAIYVPQLESHLDVSDSTDNVHSSEEEEEFDDDDDDDESEDDQETELSLGNDSNVDLTNDINWNDGGCNEDFEFDLRRCNSNDESNMEFENFCEEKNGFSNLERLNSSDLLHSYTPQMKLFDQNVGPSSSNLYADNDAKGKRHLDVDDIDDYYHHNNNQQKRMRIDTPQSGFDSYMEQMQSTIEKTRMLYAEKEKACVDAHFQLKCMNEFLESKDELIKDLQKTQVEEQQSWDSTVDSYMHEMNALANIVFSYRKALKETQKKFDEYRKMCPKGDEFLYHDVVGPGGLVLTLKEMEKMKFEKEKEMKLVAEEMVQVFECEWLVKFEEYNELILLNDTRLTELEEKVKSFKERIGELKSKSS